VLRALAAVLALAAAGGWAACVLPARQARDRARADFARARLERERLRLEVAGLERGMGGERGTRGEGPPRDAAEAARSLRRSFLRATAGLPLGEVSLSASRAGGSGRGATRGTLTAEGRLADLLRLSERLLEPTQGVRIRLVTLGIAPGGDHATKRIEIECSGEGAGS
jgi:hypothetical protein